MSIKFVCEYPGCKSELDTSVWCPKHYGSFRNRMHEARIYKEIRICNSDFVTLEDIRWIENGRKCAGCGGEPMERSYYCVGCATIKTRELIKDWYGEYISQD